jgi:hypothetical protein
LIPKLNDGVLPSGIHPCTLQECQNTFGKFSRSDRRQRLTEALARYLKDVASTGIAVGVLVDGSYVTSKLEPNDIDLILVLRSDFDPAVELRPMEYNIQSKRTVKKLYGFDVLPAIQGSETYEEYVQLFSQVRLDDSDQQTTQSVKGLLRIDV